MFSLPYFALFTFVIKLKEAKCVCAKAKAKTKTNEKKNPALIYDFNCAIQKNTFCVCSYLSWQQHLIN